jgi:hypothetical protein
MVTKYRDFDYHSDGFSLIHETNIIFLGFSVSFMSMSTQPWSTRAHNNNNKSTQQQQNLDNIKKRVI